MKLVDNWAQHLWKAWSIRLAGFAAMLGWYFSEHPDALADLKAMVPEGLRPIFSILIGFIIFTAASGTKLVKQKNLSPPPEDES